MTTAAPPRSDQGGLSDTAWNRLHRRYTTSGDPALLDQLTRAYWHHARSLARRLHRGREPLEDLEQVALEALTRAVQRFDPDRGLPFPAFATPTILGALKRHYRDQGWSVRVPRRLDDVVVPARATTERLTADLGRVPTRAEVARELSVSPETVAEAQAAAQARETSSLDAPTADGGTGAERVGELDDELGRAVDRIDVGAAMAHLDQDDREILCRYFADGHSQSRIADHLGVSQMQISRRLSSSLRRLRHHLG